MIFKAGLAGILFSFLTLFTPGSVLASEYVLPYPSYMPGHRLYNLEEVFDRLMRYWYFGNLARAKHEMSLADKKLVEAKILFEYHQHQLAVEALKKADDHFQNTAFFLKKASAEGKDTKEKNGLN